MGHSCSLPLSRKSEYRLASPANSAHTAACEVWCEQGVSLYCSTFACFALMPKQRTQPVSDRRNLLSRPSRHRPRVDMWVRLMRTGSRAPCKNHSPHQAAGKSQPSAWRTASGGTHTRLRYRFHDMETASTHCAFQLLQHAAPCTKGPSGALASIARQLLDKTATAQDSCCTARRHTYTQPFTFHVLSFDI